jgi:pyruvate dehydrogenase E2 component (dihydrolipoamide acetyltransferase)
MDVLAEMETDKALVEVPSPYAGKIVALHGKEGEIVHVGNPIVSYENAHQGGKPVHNGTHQKTADDVSSSDETREDAGTVVGTMDTQPKLGGGDGKAQATPAVRRLARERGVDLARVQGTGRGGRITASDVESAASASSSATAAARSASTSSAPKTAPAPAPTSFAQIKVDAEGTSERVAFKGVRRKIAEALERSVKTAVHFTVMDTADVTQLDRVRRQQAAASGEKVSFLPFLVQATCRALRKYPKMNAVVDDAASEILIKGVINMGIAVDTDHGLMVPVIAQADRLGIFPLGREIVKVAEACRNRTIPIEQLRGGTFTISNVGSYGGAFATPIINYPEVGILGIGRAREAVMARNGGIFVGLELPLSMSCDHRVVDGVYAAMMLNEIVQLLEHPDILLEPAGR